MNSMDLKILLPAVLLICSFSVAGQVTGESESKPPAKANSRPDTIPEPVSEPYDEVPTAGLAKCVTLETKKGQIILEMFPDTAPNTVRNFLNLAAIGALKNTTFSRVVPDFVIQGGNLYSNPDLTYEMSIRAQKNIPDEPNLVRHERGIVSMARTDEPNSASTDFFILVADAPSLDNKFASFGRVFEGMEVVDSINKMPVDDETPKDPVLITDATVADCDFKPRPAPKANDLPEAGLRGKVRSVRESTTFFKAKKKDWDRSDVISVDESLTEYGEIGDFIRYVLFKTDGSFAAIITRESTIAAPGEAPSIKEVIKDPQGTIIGGTEKRLISTQTFEFKAYGSKMKLVKTGVIETNENGRVVRQSYDRFGIDGKPDGRFKNTLTYDAYGFVTTHTQTDGDGRISFFNRYEYIDFDDQGNWTERLVYESEEAKEAAASVKRKIEYYESE